MDPPKKFRMNEGDWICPGEGCGNVNFARRTSCNLCGKEKEKEKRKQKLCTEIGKAAAEKSKGLFNAEDWQCSKCCNVNWARRSSCNICNAPKFGEVEERTGLGGGYNERGVVEYVEREDSDDEFDEFGRKKKHKNQQRRSSPTKKVKISEEDKTGKKNGGAAGKDDRKGKEEEESEEEEEDDDEDEDEDGDLSKYDLSEWDDLASAVKDSTSS